MEKILFLNDSKSGNTKKKADYVAEGARRKVSNEVKIKTIDSANKDDIIWCDGIALGSPANMGILSWKMKQFWDDEMWDCWGKIDGKIGCAFSSSGGWGGGSELTCMSLLTILINFGFMVFG